jgi:hypothetical protein
MLLTEVESGLEMNRLIRAERPFIVILVDLDDALANIPSAKLGNLLGGDGVVVPREIFSLDDQCVCFVLFFDGLHYFSLLGVTCVLCNAC